MVRLYEVKKKVKGDTVSDLYLLSCPDNYDYNKRLHSLGLEYCRSEKRGQDLCDNGYGLTMDQFLINVSPEMCARHGFQIIKLSEKAIPADSEPMVLGPYEMDTYREGFSNYYDMFRKVYNVSQLIARQLEALRSKQHSVVSKWSAATILNKALTWGHQYVNGNDTDLDLFLDGKLKTVTGKRKESAVMPSPANIGAIGGQVTDQ